MLYHWYKILFIYQYSNIYIYIYIYIMNTLKAKPYIFISFHKTTRKNCMYLPNPSAGAWCDPRLIFKRILTGLNSEFSFSSTGCHTKAKEPSLLYYFPIAGGRIIGQIPFQRVLALCEMKTVLSSIWTHVTVSISYDINHGLSTKIGSMKHCRIEHIFSNDFFLFWWIMTKKDFFSKRMIS